MLSEAQQSALSAHAVLRHARGNDMRAKRQTRVTEMRAEYNFDYSKAVRGKYYRRLLKEGANVVVLEPDVAQAFANSAAVNDALRSLLKSSEDTRRLKAPSSPRPRRRAPNT